VAVLLTDDTIRDFFIGREFLATITGTNGIAIELLAARSLSTARIAGPY
jgi:hypothetical protein